ncbi:Mitochondrial oxaloacetate carrier protein [Coemansia sp. RSA 353]|nr:Mitochondrial oxaloacetate carrier protein [Coemansia sp. RSA 788]KAJ2149317.1 Mitochondrial oxaloacetate carrier protein [Coemansia sp. RSA 564]KAJ2170006.1 Mitochondrial oxaloacetate carrier protein [Coemansia sp. RSA 562]KAJ2176335.1 Mitochondrial oxaloacetate carrier protein [Coemansia sp. RSA 560]KAJ2191305.1 Mitochondrial oxaloacetate carrier protein [Coemansia sp. RSA 532]KAJ2199777.1 Mitochondrial oxaloacetate carrier protein [Coemansia sp. RSA 530]KAJ2209059.1 Mitochondrial oxaloa
MTTQTIDVPSGVAPGVAQNNLFFAWFAGSLASCGAVTFTNPVEVVKTRLQLQGELAKATPGVERAYHNVAQAFWAIGKNEGLWGLQKGLGPGYMYQIMLNGTRLGFYEPVKNALYTGVTGSTSRGQAPIMALNVAAGGLCGVAGAALGSPFFLVKTRMQSASKFAAVGHQHNYTSSIDGLRRIWQAGGIRGLYRGMDAAMMRAGAGSAVQLATYDHFKSYISRTLAHRGLTDNSVYTHFLASMGTGFFVCLAMNPFDVVSTRMYNQKTVNGQGALYRNPFQCFYKTVASEGVLSLYKGFLAHYLRLGPHTILMFVFVEQIKALGAQYF